MKCIIGQNKIYSYKKCTLKEFFPEIFAFFKVCRCDFHVSVLHFIPDSISEDSTDKLRHRSFYFNGYNWNVLFEIKINLIIPILLNIKKS